MKQKKRKKKQKSLQEGSESPGESQDGLDGYLVQGNRNLLTTQQKESITSGEGFHFKEAE